MKGNYRFELNSRLKFTCPQCGKERRFVRYYDNETGDYLSEIAGRCDREANCGYHLRPKEYFERYGNREQITSHHQPKNKQVTYTPKREPAGAYNYIPFDSFKASLQSYERNNLYLYLQRLFGERLASCLVSRYYLGTTKYLPGAPVFWYIDFDKRITAGKVIYYPDSKTGKRYKPETHFNNKPVINWVHSILNLKDYNRKPCFFGEHLLREEPDKSVLIVESEKTALILSVFYPDCIVLATGGLSISDRFYWELLKGRQVVLIPDLSKEGETFNKWVNKAEEFNRLFNLSIEVSPELENIATESDRESGSDAGDFLTRDTDPEQGFILFDGLYPVFWEYTTETINGKEILTKY